MTDSSTLSSSSSASSAAEQAEQLCHALHQMALNNCADDAKIVNGYGGHEQDKDNSNDSLDKCDTDEDMVRGERGY